jgi:hypothetical protein
MGFFNKMFASKVESEAGVDSSKVQKEYIGHWKSRFGSYIKINSSGKAECERIVWEGTKTSTKSIKDGIANLGNGVISIQEMDTKQDFRIDKAPYLENGTYSMVLDDILYSRIA